MQDEHDNQSEVITGSRSAPLHRTIEWLGDKSNEIIRDKKAWGLPAWLSLPAIGLGLFFIFIFILILLVLLGAYLLFRLLSLPFANNHRAIFVGKRVFKN